MNPRESLCFLRIEQIRWRFDACARIHASRSYDDASRVAKTSDVARGQAPIVLTLDDRVGRRVVLVEVGVPVEYTEHVDARLEKRRGRGRDDSIRCRSRAAGKNDRHSLDFFHQAALYRPDPGEYKRGERVLSSDCQQGP